jgi:HEAT repeat protein
VNERYIAEKVLLGLGPVAVPFLADALLSGAPSLQREAALVLGRIGDAAAAPALRKALGLRDAKARARAVDALRLVGDREALDLVAARLPDEDPEVRANAARMLGEMADAKHLGALREALARETAPAAATRLSIALSRLGEDQDERLRRVFVEGEQLDRQAAAEELRRLDPGWAGDPLAPREQREAAAAAFRRK